MKRKSTKNDTVGIHYELPDGRIVYTYGFNSLKNEVYYYFDDGKGGRTASDRLFHLWKPRRDLKDFPNAKDPRLPYVFDLLWDIKYKSQLKQALANGHEDLKLIRQEMNKFKIVC